MSGSWRRIECKRIGEIEPDFGFDRHLIDTGKLVFYWVFDGDDIIFGIIEFTEHRIKRGRLSGTGGTGARIMPCGASTAFLNLPSVA